MSRSRQLSTEEKEALVRRMEAGERVGALATETGVLRKSLYQWRAAWRTMGVARLTRKRGPKPGGRQQADLDFFREALRSWDAKRRGSGAPISSPSSKK